MEPNKLGHQSPPPAEAPRAKPAGTAPLAPASQGTARLQLPGLSKPDAKPDTKEDAKEPKEAEAPPKLARDGNATTPEGRKFAEKAANAYASLLASADRDNRSLDQVFGKFQARASAEDAAKKNQEKLGIDDKAKPDRDKAGGAQELSGTGRAILRNFEKPVEALEKEEETPKEAPQPDIFEEDENGTSERRSLDKMAPERQAAYMDIASNLMSDPEARLGLQALLLSGKLSADAPDADGKDLLAGLEALVKSELGPGIEPWGLMADIVADLALPSAISAESGPTDPVMVVLIALASTRPAEYVRLLRGLASAEGQVKLANGRMLSRKGRLRKGDARWSTRLLWECLDDAEEEDEEERRKERRRGLLDRGRPGQQGQGQQQGQQQGQGQPGQLRQGQPGTGRLGQPPR